MPIQGPALVIVLGLSWLIWGGSGVKAGSKWIINHTIAKVVHVIHPHKVK